MNAVRILKTKWFVRFARRAGMTDTALREAVGWMRRGLVDADLGGGVIKQRVARRGEGKSGGYRVLVAYEPNAMAVFIYGFAKSERDNIGDDELASAREIAQGWLQASEAQLARAIKDGLLQEVDDEDDEAP